MRHLVGRQKSWEKKLKEKKNSKKKSNDTHTHTHTQRLTRTHKQTRTQRERERERDEATQRNNKTKSSRRTSNRRISSILSPPFRHHARGFPRWAFFFVFRLILIYFVLFFFFGLPRNSDAVKFVLSGQLERKCPSLRLLFVLVFRLFFFVCKSFHCLLVCLFVFFVLGSLVLRWCWRHWSILQY